MNHNIELLSPAGNIESLKVAINNGADAVYLGLDDFNARGNIENFSIKNLKEIVDYAHLFNVKIYITLNTLINDDEFNRVYLLVKQALNSNVDAFIVQDLGLAYFLKKTFPNIELHASTQMGIENLEGALFVKKIGFSRIVLARETPLTEIKRIKDNCDIEIEYFIQGALCVSFSGNCYLCSLLANSSGNRGKCKQFCRLPYSLKNENIKKEGYLLSTKDFCMAPVLKELADAGVKSFKIEGRARRPAYVAQSVKTYRKIIDNDFKFNSEDILDLKEVFNRGNFINGYFKNEPIIYSNAQNHIGVPIGKIIKVNSGKKFNEIYLESQTELHNGDVLKFFENNKEMGIITINDLKKRNFKTYSMTSTAIVKEGWHANIIVDVENEEKLLQNQRKIKINAQFSAKPNEKAVLNFNYNNVSIKAESDFIVQKAISHPIEYKDCLSQFAKLGDYFELGNLECNIENIFIAKSQLNELRRVALEKLKEKIIENYEIENKLDQKKIETKNNIKLYDLHNKNCQKMVVFHDFSDFNVVKGSYDIYVYQPRDYNIDNLTNLYEKYSEYKIYISFPIMANYEEIILIKKIIDICKNWGVYANNYYALELTSKDKTIIGSNMNVYNSYTVNYYSSLGYKNIALTIEDIDYTKIKNNGSNLFIFTSFYPEYMYFRHCPFKEHLQSKCSNCKYNEDLTYKLNNNEFKIVREKLISCQFVLKSMKKFFRNEVDNFNIIEEV